jgi:hypothetical protein
MAITSNSVENFPNTAIARRHRLLTWGLTACAVTCFIVFIGTTQVQHLSAEAVPARLRRGDVTKISISPDLSAPYEISLVLQRRPEIKTADCLLGVSSSPDSASCKNINSIAVFDWTIYDAQIFLINGNSKQYLSASWGDNDISRNFGTAMMQRGHKYEIEIKSLTDGSALSVANPMFIVGPRSDYIKHAVATQTTWCACAILFALAAGSSTLTANFGSVLRKLLGEKRQ